MPYLKRLTITQLRNIHQETINLSASVNLFYGDNGSGKTSLLEAISLLGVGRSFRSHKIRTLINDESSHLIVFGELIDKGIKTSIGLQKASNGRNDIRINQENAHSLAELANLLPLKIIDASTFQLLEGSSQQRRRFLDWMVFHVKPEFIDLWQRLNRALKQRNSLLRHDKIERSALAPWDKELSQLSTAINDCRYAVFTEFLVHLKKCSTGFFKESIDISIDYDAGWDTDVSFEQVLADNFNRDCRDGYTHKGAHRAELKIKVNGKPAADTLSRGQIKSLICLLSIVSAQFYQKQKGASLLFLIDDLPAELDKHNAVKLIRHLNALDSQLFVTGIDRIALEALFSEEAGIDTQDLAMFHVEHGKIVRQ